MNEPLVKHAAATIQAGSKSFATAARLFDARTRRSAIMLYAWCRHCDDVIDSQQLGFAHAQQAPDSAARQLADPRHRPALAGVAARLIETAEPYYRSALGGLPALPLRSAWAIATAHGVYREIGMKVKAQGARAWEHRVSTSKGEKLRLLAQGTRLALSSRGEKSDPRPAYLWQRPL
ncbi:MULTISPECIES: squalene/phytoene synthase family protein [Halomonadaceae]|uniref:squalene/phytoene synthase family protein n=1 Tax=Halomonadaceae TaxID=28256 RepID=UPI00159A5AAE|nr:MULTISPECIES: squalene/phytoene synthase family protein [Halomonas]QJQ96342.1 squalene/phytoene synthase family protein [Halomonas sp. PA5]